MTIKVFGIGIILVGSLFVYSYILGFFGQQNLALTNSINAKSLLMFILYCTAFVALVTIFFKNRYKKIAQTIIIGSVFFIGIAYGGLFTSINILILYYLISAYAEEYMKYSAGNNMFIASKQTNESSIIFFCILIGLGFSAVENIFYIISTILNKGDINIINILIGRGLVSTLIHMVSTSLIAFIIIKSKKINNTIIPIILGILGGFGLHSIYNISLQYNLSYITIPVVIFSFFLMTYLTFQSDIIYNSSNK